MNNLFWPLAINTWGEEERSAAHRVIDSGNLTMGDEVTAFEREFAAYIGSRYAVMVNSGSSANLLAVATMMKSGRCRMNGEVVVPAIAWSTTYAPLHQHNLSLKVVDVSPRTINVSMDSVKSSIGTNTMAMIGVSILGNPAPVDEMRNYADCNDLFFIEDNCESMGATIDGKFCGTFGHIGTFSTFFSHHLNTGEGGMLVTNDDELYEFAVCMRAHGWTRNLPNNMVPKDKYIFTVPGYNLRPTELAAAVGRVQLRELDVMNTQRRRNWTLWSGLFAHGGPWGIQCIDDKRHRPVPFGFVMIFNNVGARNGAQTKLTEAGIESRMVTGGCFSNHPAASYYNWSSTDNLNNARHIHHCGLFVGNHPVDLNDQIQRMKEVLS